MSNDNLKFGIIGCGSVVRDLHMPAWAQLDRVFPVAVCDVNENLLTKFVSDYRIPHAYANVGEFLAAQSQDLDFICVATPPFTHCEIAKKVLESGNHLLIEKPIAQSLREAEGLRELAESKSLLACVIHNYRFRDNVATAFKELNGGSIGELQTIYCRFRTGRFSNYPANWANEERRNRLLLYDSAIHLLDLVVCFGGPVKRIKGIDYIADDRITKYVGVISEHQNGVRSILELEVHSTFKEASLQLRGERCVADIQFYPDGISFNRSQRGLFSMQNPLTAFRNEANRLLNLVVGVSKERLGLSGKRRASSHHSLFLSFIQSLRDEGKQIPISIEAVMPTMRFLDEISEIVYQKNSKPGNPRQASAFDAKDV